MSCVFLAVDICFFGLADSVIAKMFFATAEKLCSGMDVTDARGWCGLDEM